MNLLPVLQFPDETLRKRSRTVTDIDAGVVDFATRLTMMIQENRGCVGIAAPQVGDLRRIIVVDVSGHKKATDKHGLLVMINPLITGAQGSVVTREGCLSVPDFTGNVERRSVLGMRYLTTEGTESELETSGFEAVVLQHEIDHLDGILFVDRLDAEALGKIKPRLNRLKKAAGKTGFMRMAKAG
jgi:peptide deformylase